jgi:hypothetical protein
MEEKIISEFKVIETEDGYRIEIKGNKEQIKKMIEGRFGFGRRGPFGGRHHHRGFGPFGFWGHHGPWGHGPWGWTDDEEEDQPEQTEKA